MKDMRVWNIWVTGWGDKDNDVGDPNDHPVLKIRWMAPTFEKACLEYFNDHPNFDPKRLTLLNLPLFHRPLSDKDKHI